MLPRLALTLALVAFVCPRAVFAQTAPPEPESAAPAHVAYIEGAVTLERDGRPETAPLNMPLLSGDRLKTITGRAEVLFADGSALQLDEQTTVDIQSDELARLIDGRLRLNIAGPGRGIAYRVDSPAGSVRITLPGEYRIAILRRENEMQLELAVLRGGGEIFTDEGTTAVRAGERAYASAGLAPSYAYTYNSANWDDFDRWSESRRDTRMGVSAQYLPSEVRAYSSTFDEQGDWRYEQSYGYVWYPRVAVSWRPYYYGRWAQYPRYGWTWIGVDRFAWPTHHYGRWGFRANAWFWIPANRWAPAHVSWAYAPGYVSWCPLGFDNRPVFGLNYYNVGPGYYSARAWTAIGYSHFGRDYVHRRAVDWDRVDHRRPAFQVGRSAPAYRDVAVSRNSSPIRWAGSGTRAPQGGSQSVGATRSTEAVASRGLARDTGSRASTGSTTAGLVPSGGRATPRTDSAAPRYINRGDEIVRSRTERPSAPAPAGVPLVPGNAAGDAVSPRTGYAVPRTAPAGPARRIDTPGVATVPDPSGIASSRSRDAAAGRYAPRSAYESPDQARTRAGVGARPDDPAYRPQPYQPPVRTYERAQPRSVTPTPEPSGAAAPAGVPSPGYARPRGGFESGPAPAPAPNAGSGRQAPAPRAMPSPGGSAPSGGSAVPRDGGGRGPAPAASGSGARSRGRGGA